MPALIFDCDGVLADTERDGHLVAFNDTFVDLGVPVRWTQAEYARLLSIGGGKERIAAGLGQDDLARLGPAGTPDERAALIKTIHAKKTERFLEIVRSGAVPTRPGIRRIILAALAADWTVAVASTSAEVSVRAVLEQAVGPEAAAACHVFAGDIVAHKKPAPDIYLTVLADLGLDPADCLVVEDSAVGLRAAKAAGLRTLVTTSAFTAKEDFEGAEHVLPDLGEDESPHAVQLVDLEHIIATH